MYLAYDKLFLVLPLAVLVGLLAVALVGLVNGLITVYLGVSSLITTLGMFFLLAGLNVTLTGGFPATPPDTNFVTQALGRSEEHTSELKSRQYLVCRLLLEKKNPH